MIPNAGENCCAGSAAVFFCLQVSFRTLLEQKKSRSAKTGSAPHKFSGSRPA
nr:MAG TPA: hypothetical protein [Caudoviricetes sp.]